MNEPTAAVELPLYSCHKQVRAAKITGIYDSVDGTTTLILGDISGYVSVDADWMQKHTPVSGGYYVVYADGYASFSPAQPFETGYTKAPQPGAPVPGVRRFRKKPVAIEAVQWTGENLREVIAFTGKHPIWSKWFASLEEYEARVRADGGIFKIITPEGMMKATPGDFIIKGVNGEFYPCKPDIFAKTYEDAGTEVAPLNTPSPVVDLIGVSRALLECVTPTKPPFGQPFRDHDGNRIDDRPEWKALREVVGHHDAYVLGAAQDVVSLVEGVDAPRWQAGGLRLKDVREWCMFYSAVKTAEREATATNAKPAAIPSLTGTDDMVDRFLQWRLPAAFNPDGGITFTPPSSPTYWPSGTNLLDAQQARSMLEHVLAIP